MSVTAKVEQGKIVLPADVHWPTGTLVRIEPLEHQPASKKRIAPLHPGAWDVAPDFDEPLSEDFLLGKL